MKTQKAPKKTTHLSLKRETVRQLTDTQLSTAVGGKKKLSETCHCTEP